MSISASPTRSDQRAGTPTDSPFVCSLMSLRSAKYYVQKTTPVRSWKRLQRASLRWACVLSPKAHISLVLTWLIVPVLRRLHDLLMAAVRPVSSRAPLFIVRGRHERITVTIALRRRRPGLRLQAWSLPVRVLAAWWSRWFPTRVRLAIVTLVGLPPLPSGCVTRRAQRRRIQVVRRTSRGVRTIAT